MGLPYLLSSYYCTPKVSNRSTSSSTVRSWLVVVASVVWKDGSISLLS